MPAVRRPLTMKRKSKRNSKKVSGIGDTPVIAKKTPLNQQVERSLVPMAMNPAGLDPVKPQILPPWLALPNLIRCQTSLKSLIYGAKFRNYVRVTDCPVATKSSPCLGHSPEPAAMDTTRNGKNHSSRTSAVSGFIFRILLESPSTKSVLPSKANPFRPPLG